MYQENKGGNQSANGIQQYDIAIVGGGLVGMALACSLGQSRLLCGGCMIALAPFFLPHPSFPFLIICIIYEVLVTCALMKNHQSFDYGSVCSLPECQFRLLIYLVFLAASSAITRKLSVAIIDDNPALNSGGGINKDEPPDPRVSTVTPAAISFLESMLSFVLVYFVYQLSEYIN